MTPHSQRCYRLTIECQCLRNIVFTDELIFNLDLNDDRRRAWRQKNDHLRDSCKINKMSINPLKSKCMILGSNHRLKHLPDLTLRVENHLIKNVSSQTVMGVKIDNNLKWL